MSAVSKDLKRLAWLLGSLWLVLCLLSVLLGQQALERSRYAALHQYRLLAQAQVAAVLQPVDALLAFEQARPVDDYDPNVSSSPLQQWPVADAPEGTLGYFQLSASGRFTVPGASASATDGLARRDRLAELLQDATPVAFNEAELERDNALVAEDALQELVVAAPAAIAEDKVDQRKNQAVFDRFISRAPNSYEGRYDNAASGLGSADAESAAKVAPNERAKRASRTEPTLQYDVEHDADAYAPSAQGRRQAQAAPIARETDTLVLNAPDLNATEPVLDVDFFRRGIEPLQWLALSEAHWVLFRRVFIGDELLVQGLVLDAQRFLRERLLQPLQGGPDACCQHQVTLDARPLLDSVVLGDLVFERRLPAPLDALSIAVHARTQQRAPGTAFIGWSIALLLSLLSAGFVGLFLLGRRQVLARQQQQDFISAVSHELKTPLTSIRMYGEMLKSGWASEDKRMQYYDYIFNESERLSRLINNVLQLSRIDRRALDVQCEPMSVATLLDLVTCRVDAQRKAAGFELTIHCSTATGEVQVLVDEDAWLQIMINLIDNAMKFSAQAPRKEVVIEVHPGEREVAFAVRDFGPGIDRSQLKRVFELFYRGEDELTRETVGTGIGLALVARLTNAMGGQVSVSNAESGEPSGAKFRVTLPRAGR